MNGQEASYSLPVCSGWNRVRQNSQGARNAGKPGQLVTQAGCLSSSHLSLGPVQVHPGPRLGTGWGMPLGTSVSSSLPGSLLKGWALLSGDCPRPLCSLLPRGCPSRYLIAPRDRPQPLLPIGPAPPRL